MFLHLFLSFFTSLSLPFFYPLPSPFTIRFSSSPFFSLHHFLSFFTFSPSLTVPHSYHFSFSNRANTRKVITAVTMGHESRTYMHTITLTKKRMSAFILQICVFTFFDSSLFISFFSFSFFFYSPSGKQKGKVRF